METPKQLTRLERLSQLVTEVAGSPEHLYVATVALADELERLAIDEKSTKSVRRTAQAVKPMLGMEAETAWKKLSWRERFRNRKRVDDWKDQFTEALLDEGRRRVDDILRAQ